MDNMQMSSRVKISDNVLIRELEDQAVLLNLNNESYYGLDDVGTRMWTRLTTSDSIEVAYQFLLDEYDADPELLRHDIQTFLADLIEHGLVCIEDATMA